MKRFGLLALIMTLGVSAKAQSDAPAAPTEETKTEEAKAAEAKPEEPKAEEAKPEEAKAEEATPAPQAQAPAASGTGVQEIQATQVTEATTATMTTEEAEAKKKADALAGLSAQERNLAVARQGGPRAIVIFDNSLGSGGFVANDKVRDANGYFAQSLSVRPGYTFPFMGHTLAAGANVNFTFEYTTPNNEAGRSWNFLDTRLTLSDPNIYTEPVTGIRISAGVRWDLPTSHRSLNVTSMWSGFGANVGLQRSIGPVDLSYSSSILKEFNSNKIARRATEVPRSNDNVLSAANKDDPAFIAAGSANASLLISNSASASYNFDDYFSTTYQVSVTNILNYAMPIDEYSSGFAQGGMGQQDQVVAVLDFSYEFSRKFADVFNIPFRMILSAGVFTFTPGQSLDNGNIMWPVFVNAFGNRSSNNYGSFYFDVTGVFL